MIHELKILPKWFEDVVHQKKTFEIRKNDRNYSVGDTLILKEWYRGKYTGREVKRTVSYIYYGDGTYGLSDEYVVMAIEPLKQQKTAHWVKKEDAFCWWYECDQCGKKPLRNRLNDEDALSDWCPNCGAKMEGEKDK